jgi:hypothetical protein
MFIVAVGALLVVIGVFLPWADVAIESSGLGLAGAASVSGIDVSAGQMNVILAIGNGLLGYLAARNDARRAGIGFLVVLASAAILTMTVAFAVDPVGGELTVNPFDGADFEELEIGASADLRSGVFVTAAGGALLLIGGLALLAIPARSAPNHIPQT